MRNLIKCVLCVSNLILKDLFLSSTATGCHHQYLHFIVHESALLLLLPLPPPNPSLLPSPPISPRNRTGIKCHRMLVVLRNYKNRVATLFLRLPALYTVMWQLCWSFVAGFCGVERKATPAEYGRGRKRVLLKGRRSGEGATGHEWNWIWRI